MPGASFSSTARVASGVTSRGVRPVPPVVSTRSAASASAQDASTAGSRTVSSGTSARSASAYPRPAAHAAIASPEVSARSPRCPASEMVRMARRMGLFLHAALRPERQLHDLGREALAAAFDLEPGARLPGGGGGVGGADADAERRAHGAAPHDVHLAAVVVRGEAVARDAAALEAEPDEPAGDAARLLRAQRLDADERGALVELHDPAEVGLERRDGIVDLVAVE